MRYRTKLLNNEHKKNNKLFIIAAALLIISTTLVVKVNPELLALIKQATPVHLEKQAVFAKTEPLQQVQNNLKLTEADSFEDYNIEYKEDNLAVEVEKKPAEITEEELLALVEKLEDTYFEEKETKQQKKEEIQTKTTLPTPELTAPITIMAKATPKPEATVITPIISAKKNIAKKKEGKKKKIYTLQFASFIKKTNAQRVANKLINSGFPAYVQQGYIKGEEWFRVRVGKFNSQLSAKENSTLIANMTGNKSYIAQYVDIP